jgi:hypothetical protein
METEVDVDNPGLAIDSGMYANALMRLNHADQVLTVPVGAIILHGDQQQLYVLDASNHVEIRNVQVGIRGSQLAEIQSGVNPGDRVILAAQAKYDQGEAVTPVVEKSPASETAPQTGGMIDMNGDATSTSGGQQ